MRVTGPLRGSFKVYSCKIMYHDHCFQKFILMEECTRQWSKPADPSLALVITNATIGWELPTQQNTEGEESKVKGEVSKVKGEESKVKGNDVTCGDDYEAAATAKADDEEAKDQEAEDDVESVVDSVNDNALNETLLAKEEGIDRKITVCLRNVNLTLEKVESACEIRKTFWSSAG